MDRASVQYKLCFGELAVDIMKEHAVDERARRNEEARKGSVEKVNISVDQNLKRYLDYQSIIEYNDFLRAVD